MREQRNLGSSENWHQWSSSVPIQTVDELKFVEQNLKTELILDAHIIRTDCPLDSRLPGLSDRDRRIFARLIEQIEFSSQLSIEVLGCYLLKNERSHDRFVIVFSQGFDQDALVHQHQYGHFTMREGGVLFSAEFTFDPIQAEFSPILHVHYGSQAFYFELSQIKKNWRDYFATSGNNQETSFVLRKTWDLALALSPATGLPLHLEIECETNQYTFNFECRDQFDQPLIVMVKLEAKRDFSLNLLEVSTLTDRQPNRALAKKTVDTVPKPINFDRLNTPQFRFAESIAPVIIENQSPLGWFSRTHLKSPKISACQAMMEKWLLKLASDPSISSNDLLSEISCANIFSYAEKGTHRVALIRLLNDENQYLLPEAGGLHRFEFGQVAIALLQSKRGSLINFPLFTSEAFIEDLILAKLSGDQKSPQDVVARSFICKLAMDQLGLTDLEFQKVSIEQYGEKGCEIELSFHNQVFSIIIQREPSGLLRFENGKILKSKLT